MTAPTRTRRRSAGEPSRRRASQPEREATRAERPTRNGQTRSTAAERAYARRAQRADGQRRETRKPQGKKLLLRWPKSRASFVLIVMTLLAVGVITTLLLSTQAIADSYRLEQIRQENSNLAEQSEQLQQDVTKTESASSLAARAKALGMVPAGEPAHLVQNADGSVTVVGKPSKAVGAPPPSTPSTPPPANTGTPAGTAPIEGDVAQGDQQEAANQPGGQ
ncbi:hypothetical protein FPZ12_038325 [Amycolatopsis acidicola]|uniref:Cell division protein FtsL n=1 Tax=Amycolatopsis acidicola TaxID=2596893 RepID=A0A5N0UR87_9PSEU|nr:hypothetical protein [Amycolatopsis acidicola]KAA9151707.1 hypothetical protein FPZ12_038325 [Amycolatopsis acidicola]